jgi:S1-C subfamily serine protease
MIALSPPISAHHHLGARAAKVGSTLLVLLAAHQANVRLGLDWGRGECGGEGDHFLIQGINPGSGVIIAREGNSYVVLTAKHVVNTEDQYQIITNDQESHPLDYKIVKRIPGIDLAVLTFTSSKDYRTARLVNSDHAKAGATVFVSGWPNPGQSTTKRIRQFTTG